MRVLRQVGALDGGKNYWARQLGSKGKETKTKLMARKKESQPLESYQKGMCGKRRVRQTERIGK